MDMYPNLLIPEIIWLICEHIRVDIHRVPVEEIDRSDYNDPASYEATKALLALALTNKFVSEIAVGALWFRIRGMRPLIKCMGVAWLGVRDPYDGNGRVSLVRGPSFPVNQLNLTAEYQNIFRALQPSDIATLKQYAARIREFTEIIPRDNDKMEEIKFLRTINLSVCDQEPLFPELRKLETQSMHLLDFIHLFGSSKLRSLHLRLDNYYTRDPDDPSPVDRDDDHQLAYTSFLANIPIRYPTLSSLVVEGCLAGYETEVLSDAVSELNGLRTLKCDYLTPSALQTLAQRPSLRALAFTLRKENCDTEYCDYNDFGSHPFPSLRELHITTDLNISVRLLLSVDTNHPLATLQCTSEKSWCPPSDWLAIVNALAKTSSSSLTSVSFLDPEPYEKYKDELPDGTIYRRVPTTFITQLAPLTSLTRLHFRYPGMLDADDQDIKLLASTLSNLEECLLETTCPPPEDSPPKVTLSSLVNFANHTPRLTSLSLTYDARMAKIPPVCSWTSPCCIRKLGVGWSLLDDPQTVAEFIFSIIPNVEIDDYYTRIKLARWWWIDGEDVDTPWMKVNQRIQALRTQRAQ